MEASGFSLHNNGGFVARIRLHCREVTGVTRPIDVPGDILLGQYSTVKFADMGIADGSWVRLQVEVVFGTDPMAAREYEAKNASQKIISYVISGTTLNNKLGVIDEG